MTTQPAIAKQLKRLFRLPFAPSDPEDAKSLSAEMRRAFERCANDQHLEAVGNHAMETFQRFPSPAEIYNLVREVPNPKVATGPMGCEVCKGTGWYSYQQNANPGGAAPYVADFSDFCDCPRGQWMRTCETSRREEQAAQKRSKGHVA